MIPPNIRLIIFLTIVIGCPILWLIAEFKWSPRVRRLCGVLALLSTTLVAVIIGLLTNLEANTFFSTQSKRLVSESVRQLEAGRVDAVLDAWKRLDETYRASYEYRAYYQELIDQAIDSMNATRVNEESPSP